MALQMRSLSDRKNYMNVWSLLDLIWRGAQREKERNNIVATKQREEFEKRQLFSEGRKRE